MTSPPAHDLFADAGDPFATILEGIADARVDEAAEARERARWVAGRAEEDATFAGALIDLAERHATVRLQLRGGREIVGTPHALGADVVALHTPAGRTFVRLGHLTAVRTGPGHTLVASTRRGTASGTAAHTPGTRTLHDVVADATAERLAARLVFDDGTEATGHLRALGADVLTLRENTAEQGTVLVSFDALSAVTLLCDR